MEKWNNSINGTISIEDSTCVMYERREWVLHYSRLVTLLLSLTLGKPLSKVAEDKIMRTRCLSVY